MVGPLMQSLSSLSSGEFKGRYERFRQIVGRRDTVNYRELLFQQRQPLVQVLVAVCGHCQR